MKLLNLLLGALLLIIIASCDSNEDISFEDNELKSLNTVPNFRVGLQFSDKNEVGEVCYTSYADNSGGWSDWATDVDSYDPDAVKLYLEVEQNNHLENLDFCIGFQGSDNGSGNQTGTVQYTPWASEGGGTTAFVSDADSYDPDAYRVIIKTRSWTSPRILSNFRLGIRMYDKKGEEAGYTKGWTSWAKDGGGPTNWITDRDGYDPDGFKVTLEVDFD